MPLHALDCASSVSTPRLIDEQQHLVSNIALVRVSMGRFADIPSPQSPRAITAETDQQRRFSTEWFLTDLFHRVILPTYSGCAQHGYRTLFVTISLWPWSDQHQCAVLAGTTTACLDVKPSSCSNAAVQAATSSVAARAAVRLTTHFQSGTSLRVSPSMPEHCFVF